jgi:hypothetical protein
MEGPRCTEVTRPTSTSARTSTAATTTVRAMCIRLLGCCTPHPRPVRADRLRIDARLGLVFPSSLTIGLGGRFTPAEMTAGDDQGYQRLSESQVAAELLFL